MLALNTDSEILDCFRGIDRREVELSPEVKLPVQVRDAFAWTVGPRAYLLLRDPVGRKVHGLVFNRGHGPGDHIVALCDWCHLVRAHGSIKLMSAAVDKQRSIGAYVCSDLACLDRNPDAQTLARIRAFAHRCLF